MPTVAILPVKSFRLGKGRMAGDLSDEGRWELGRSLAERTAELTVAAELLPLLVTGDPEVADWAVTNGFPVLPDEGSGLSGAAALGTKWAAASASGWLVLHSDLPLLGLDDLSVVGDALGEAGSVIAPSADGGTSALGGNGPGRFAYGPGSFHRHLGRRPDARVVTRLGLLHDVDSFADLESARLHPRGAWLAAFR